jgi:hypothetical protein
VVLESSINGTLDRWTTDGVGIANGDYSFDVGINGYMLTRGEEIYLKAFSAGQNVTLGVTAYGNFSLATTTGSQRFAKEEKVIVEYTGNGGTTIDADTTNIDFANKVEDSHGSWDGTTFMANSNRRFNVKGGTFWNAAGVHYIKAYKNGTLNKLIGSSHTGVATCQFDGSVYLERGNTLSIRDGSGGTLSDSDEIHWISITSED